MQKPHSNYEKSSNKPKLLDILPKKKKKPWPVLFKHAKVIKGKTEELLETERQRH